MVPVNAGNIYFKLRQVDHYQEGNILDQGKVTISVFLSQKEGLALSVHQYACSSVCSFVLTRPTL